MGWQTEGDGVIVVPSFEARKDFSTNRSNTIVVADDPDLAFTGIPSGNAYALQGFLRIVQFTTATQDFKFDWSGFCAVRGIAVYNSDGTTTPAVVGFERGVEAVIDGTVPNAGGTMEVTLQGSVRNESVSDQVLALKWAQNVSSANSVQLVTGSWLRLVRVGSATVGG